MKIKRTKTKILATIGPSSDTKEKLGALLDSGVDGFRLNFSHGSQDYFKKLFDTINDVCKKKSMSIPIVQDLQGPKIRIGELAEKEINLKSGDTIEITTKNVLGNVNLISTSYKALPNDAAVGDKILIDDGLIRLKITSKTSYSVICDIIDGGILKPKKGMNLPGMNLSTASITEKDLVDLDFALSQRVDFIALSFVRTATDIVELRNLIESKGHKKI